MCRSISAFHPLSVHIFFNASDEVFRNEWMEVGVLERRGNTMQILVIQQSRTKNALCFEVTSMAEPFSHLKTRYWRWTASHLRIERRKYLIVIHIGFFH